MTEDGPIAGTHRSSTHHASCVRVGEAGVLIRGPSGAGKSHLAFALILAGRTGLIPETVLVGDDRLVLERRGDGLFAAPVPALAGLLEVRGAGLRRLPYVAEVEVALVVDLHTPDGARMPRPEDCRLAIGGVTLTRLPVYDRGDAVHQVLAMLSTEAALQET
ncbi:HPr kinase/phosphatase C-terminal domain-containing protein [Ancylobacter sonchi]|uniref:HPr kinase/phosphorylase n=1 Tax=Ancylobacter sonchi TaxID=1937790 RepID=UPI001BD22B5D|nr:HPr kinase/phosphatase C-terminal domain-containing protein [Ancylobacter sonchi]MBS7536780.1 HPr kinase/phosphatase C-terminal domain-containing protein [Ancylobacter sonchi]